MFSFDIRGGKVRVKGEKAFWLRHSVYVNFCTLPVLHTSHLIAAACTKQIMTVIMVHLHLFIYLINIATLHVGIGQ
jgi:hypothetical protein